MSGSSRLDAPDRRVDAVILVLAALIGVLVYPPSLPFIALIAGLIVLSARSLPGFHKRAGLSGWLALSGALWVSLSGVWGQTGTGLGVPEIWLIFFALLGVPATVLAKDAGLKAVGTHIGSVAALALTLALGSLVVFETASGGFLADTVFGANFMAVYAVAAILAWPVTALLRVHFGWKEALLWTFVIPPAVILGADPTVALATSAGLFFFALGLISIVTTRLSVILLIVLCATLPPALAFWQIPFPEIDSPYLDFLGTAEAWKSLLERWMEAPLLGLGQDVFFETVSSVYGSLLVKTGAIGVGLVVLALAFSARASVRKDNHGWTGPASAGLIAMVTVAGLGGLGPFSAWWMASLVIGALTLAICRAPAPKEAALGSIFETGDQPPQPANPAKPANPVDSLKNEEDSLDASERDEDTQDDSILLDRDAPKDGDSPESAREIQDKIIDASVEIENEIEFVDDETWEDEEIWDDEWSVVPSQFSNYDGKGGR